MTPKKEHYRNKLPHFQQSGQWYFITCVLFGTMPKGAMDKYLIALETAKKKYQFLLKMNNENTKMDHLSSGMNKLIVSTSESDQ